MASSAIFIWSLYLDNYNFPRLFNIQDVTRTI
jgi:hypothetical protein